MCVDLDRKLHYIIPGSLDAIAFVVLIITGVNHTSEGFLLAELFVLGIMTTMCFFVDVEKLDSYSFYFTSLGLTVLVYSGYYGIAIADDLQDEIGAGIATIAANLHFATYITRLSQVSSTQSRSSSNSPKNDSGASRAPFIATQ